MQLEINIPEAFAELFKPHRIKCFHGGRGGGKSYAVALYLLVSGLEKPLKIVCAREFQTSIKDSVHEMLADLISEYKMESEYTVLNTEIRGKNGTSFSFVGLHRNISNIKSMHDVNKFWVEEAETVSQNSWDVLFPTIRAKDSEIIVTFNPDIEESPTYNNLVLNPPDFAYVKKVGYRDNPYFPAVLEQERLHLLEKDPVKYDNVWEGNPKAAVEGAIFAKQLQEAQEDDRIGSFKYDPLHPVSAFMDIGWADNTSIWFLQIINHEFRLIHAYQSQFQKTPHYVKYMQDTGYTYDRIVLPHDAENEHANADRTWMQIYRKAFPNANVYSGERRKIEMRLEATKNIFSKLHFDKEGCPDGLVALKRYHYAINPDTGKSTREPFHGPESNYSDALGYLALEAIEPSKPRQKKPRVNIIRRSGIR